MMVMATTSGRRNERRRPKALSALVFNKLHMKGVVRLSGRGAEAKQCKAAALHSFNSLLLGAPVGGHDHHRSGKNSLL